LELERARIEHLQLALESLQLQELSALNKQLALPNNPDRPSLVQQRDQMVAAARLALQAQKRAGATSGFVSPMYAVTAGDLTNEKLWEAAVEVDNITRGVVQPDELFSVDEVPLKADIRWLQLHISTRTTPLDKIKAMKATKKNKKQDRELAYHPLVLVIYEAAALGQTGIAFCEELHKGPAREDIRSLVTGSTDPTAKLAPASTNRMDPTEIKSQFVVAGGIEPAAQIQALDDNRDAVGKLLRCVMQNCPNPGGTRLCTFISRIHCLWVVEFKFSDEGYLTSCRVTPPFPEDGTSSALSPIITDTYSLFLGRFPEAELVSADKLHDYKSMDTLSNLLPSSPPPGFRVLVRYVDQLAESHNIEVRPVTLVSNSNQSLDMTFAVTLMQTRKSLVLQSSPAANSVIKIGPARLVAREVQIHDVVDGGPHIRCMMSSGTVEGLQEGKDDEPPLAYVELAGLGEPLSAKHADGEELAVHWQHAAEALCHLHGRSVLHRDIKPSNMIIINSFLTLNDFDCSCFMHEAGSSGDVGTPAFRNPFLSADGYTQADDWNSLVLSFLSLRLDIGNKVEALKQASDLAWVPEEMKKKISLEIHVPTKKRPRK
jgi:hypothetical protein